MGLAWAIQLISSQSAIGPIIIDPDYPHSFRYQSGERFFPMGDTAYFLIAQPTNVIAHYIDVRRAHKFNFTRAMALADGFWPFGGTPDHPQYSVIDQTVMQKWDWVFDYAAARGMNIELIMWGYGVAGGEGLWASPSNQVLWIRTLVDRFKRRNNLFMWTIANEFERYPDGKYQFDPADVEWARGVATRIRELDEIHPIGCHPSVWITDQDLANTGARPFDAYKGFTQRLPQVVWPLWEGSAVNLNVTQNNEGVQPRAWGVFDGTRKGLTYYPIHWQGVDYPARWTATGWEFEPPASKTLWRKTGHTASPSWIPNSATRMNRDMSLAGITDAPIPSAVHREKKGLEDRAPAGAYFAAGFAGSSVRNFTEKDVDNFRPDSLEVLYDFFTRKTEYWKMSPHLELAASHNVLLALPAKSMPPISRAAGPTQSISFRELTRRNGCTPKLAGSYREPDLTSPGGSREFLPPEHPNDDWVLHLRQSGPP